jgi:hypothetical protein
MVTLTAGELSSTVPADTELSIHEAAQWSGYSVHRLRRNDIAAERGFPPAHKKDGGTSRLWYASEVEKIVAFRHKTADNLGKRLKKTRAVWSRQARAARAEKKAQVAA